MTRSRTYRLFLDVKSGRQAADDFREAWFDVLRESSAFSETSRFHEGRHRTFFETSFDQGTLAVTHHEWGVEYIIAFGLGVASGLAANALYDVLKRYIGGNARAYSGVRAEQTTTTRVDVELDTPNGGVRIAVIEHSEMRIEASPKKMATLLREIDRERGLDA